MQAAQPPCLAIDFVAETDSRIYMLESKARSGMGAPEVQAKKDTAAQWCRHSSDQASNNGKPWKYALIPHDVITENMTLHGLTTQLTGKR